MKRREFITLLGGAAVAWPLAARAQQGKQMRRVGVLMNLVADDPESQARLAAFAQGLHGEGWVIGQNLRLETRWGGGDAARVRGYAAELLALAPDVILAGGSSSVGSLLEANQSVPVVFAGVGDPVGAGFVASLARPGGLATGFTTFEYGMTSKWLELLKQLAPSVTRVGVLRDPTIAVGIGQLGAIQAVAPSFGVEVVPLGARDAGEIERGVTALAGRQNSALIAATTIGTAVYRDLIISLAARHRLPTVFAFRFFVAAGGLISYGPDVIDQYRRAAGYVDRILKGEKPADLPVQAPSKYETVLNLKTAKALGLTVPPALLAIADEVIE